MSTIEATLRNKISPSELLPCDNDGTLVAGGCELFSLTRNTGRIVLNGQAHGEIMINATEGDHLARSITLLGQSSAYVGFHMGRTPIFVREQASLFVDSIHPESYVVGSEEGIIFTSLVRQKVNAPQVATILSQENGVAKAVQRELYGVDLRDLPRKCVPGQIAILGAKDRCGQWAAESTFQTDGCMWRFLGGHKLCE